MSKEEEEVEGRVTGGLKRRRKRGPSLLPLSGSFSRLGWSLAEAGGGGAPSPDPDGMLRRREGGKRIERDTADASEDTQGACECGFGIGRRFFSKAKDALHQVRLQLCSMHCVHQGDEGSVRAILKFSKRV